MRLRLCVGCRNAHIRTGRLCPDCEKKRNATPHRQAHRTPEHAALRGRVFARDHYRCVLCGAAGPLTLDYIVPLQRGGTMTPENTRTLCRSCNSGRRDYDRDVTEVETFQGRITIETRPNDDDILIA